MGLIAPMHGERWNDAERDYLRTAATARVDIAEICRRLGRTHPAVHEEAVKLKLRVISPLARTSIAEIMATRAARREQARNLRAAGKTRAEIAERLSCSISAVTAMLRTGTPKASGRPMTEEIRETVRRMYPTSVHMDEIAKATGRTPNSIIGLAHRMGLRRPERVRTWA